jgi:hypothetical protein
MLNAVFFVFLQLPKAMRILGPPAYVLATLLRRWLYAITFPSGAPLIR